MQKSLAILFLSIILGVIAYTIGSSLGQVTGMVLAFTCFHLPLLMLIHEQSCKLDDMKAKQDKLLSLLQSMMESKE